MASRKALSVSHHICSSSSVPLPARLLRQHNTRWLFRSSSMKSGVIPSRTFSNTPFKGSGASLKEQRERERIEQAAKQHALQCQRAMTVLMHRLQSVDSSQSTKANSSAFREAELDRIQADMEYVDAEDQHWSTLGAMMSKLAHLTSQDYSTFMKQEDDNLLEAAKSVGFIEEAYIASMKSLVVSFKCALPTVLAPWGHVSILKRLARLLWVVVIAGPRFTVTSAVLRIMLMATRLAGKTTQ